MLIALFGAVAGQAVVWYTGQFYALFFLEKTLKVDGATANILIAIALALGTPFFVFFGWLSDKIGRKPIILAGCALAALTYFPLFEALTDAANPALARAQATRAGDGRRRSRRLLVPVRPDRQEQVRHARLRRRQVVPGQGRRVLCQCRGAGGHDGQVDDRRRGDRSVDAAALDGEVRRPAIAAFQDRGAGGARRPPAIPAKADPAAINKPLVVAILFLLVLYVTMVYGPIAALLVELFPTRIRYTSMSLPYHIGNGWFGGFLPTTAFAMVAATGNIYYGLWYPIVVALLTLVVGVLFLPETFRRRL